MDFLKNYKRFGFLYDRKPFWDYEMQTAIHEDASELTIEYQLSDGLKVTNIGKKHPQFDAYEWVTWFENTSYAPTGIISDLYDCDIAIPFGCDNPLKWTAFLPIPEKDMKIYSPSGSQWALDEFYCDVDRLSLNHFEHHIYPGEKKSYKTAGGRSCETNAPFFNIHRQGKGVIFAIGWSGQWNCEIYRGNDFVNIKTKIEDTHFKLLPGEKIRTSSFVIMRYEGDYIDSQNKWRRFVKKEFSLIGSEGREKYAPFCAGIWGGMKSQAVIDRIHTIQAHRLPFEYIWMDAGWYGPSTQASPDEFEGDWSQHTGDWRVNETHHPDGLLEVAKAIKEAGLKFILWFEPERVIQSTPIACEHPEYVIRSPFENDANTLLNLGNRDAWQYCFDMLSEKIETLGIDCYRQDFNFSPLEFWRSQDAWDRKGVTEIKHIMGLYALWDALLEKFPHLLIDNCASGGRRIDIELLKRSVPLWRSDAQCPADYPPEFSQTHNMTYGTWLPYSGTGSGRESGDVYRIRSAYAGGMTTNYTFSEKNSFGDDPQELEWIKKYGSEYLRVRPYFSCDFYPLTEMVSKDDAWCASQYNRPKENDGIVQVFKRKKSPYCLAKLKLRGLDDNKTYIFTDADDGTTYEFSGSDLKNAGFPVEIENPRTAKLYFYSEK